ncbi:MAG: hypothetical protein KatS3mg113_0347 [Planctomycetaceae bacterium]|nr:MAG: hypothetical protein KatS3mg113_0347 [Planctomycetaceae bacterium]
MDYHLKPVGKTCAATGKSLQPGMLCYSVVVERHGQFVRLDYSEQGWQGPPPDAIGYWRTRVPHPHVPVAIEPQALLRYFEQMTEEDAPHREIERYVAAVLLLKSRKLRLRDVEIDDSGKEWLHLEGIRGEGPYRIARMPLPDAEFEHWHHLLKQHLATEWTA